MDRSAKKLHKSNISIPERMVQNDVPTYDLYGERSASSPNFWLHCETIPSRSSLHHWEIGLHRHESFFQLLYISDGSGDAVFGREILAIRPGSVVTVPPGFGHGFRFSQDIDGFVFTLLSSHLRVVPGGRSRLGIFLAAPRVTVLDPDDADARHVGETLKRLGAEWLSRQSGRTDLMEAYLTTALTLTARLWGGYGDEEGIGGANERRVERLNALVHQHFRSHRPAAFYASELGLSSTHLNRIVRAVTGEGAHDFIARKLMEEARRELALTTATIKDIAYRLGFSDAAYFTRVFARRTGMTPKAWRAAEREKTIRQAQSSE
jgi:AraC family transcriptional activator of pobA